jgi:hypothetical protein
MPWTLSYDSEGNFVETTYSGTLAPDDLRAAIEQSLALARDRGTILFLGNCSMLEGGHSVVDLYFFVGLLETGGVPRTMREAILMPALDSSAAGNVHFWETAARNRGFEVRIFSDRGAALEWLAGLAGPAGAVAARPSPSPGPS